MLRELAAQLDAIVSSNTGEHTAAIQTANAENAEKAAAAKEKLKDFASPLQQKIELLKKAVGEESFYDENGQNDAQCDDELTHIKRIAGIVPINELADDEEI